MPLVQKERLVLVLLDERERGLGDLFSTEFIDQREQPQWPSIMGPSIMGPSIMGLCMNKVVAPDMILEGGTQPNTGSIS